MTEWSIDEISCHWFEVFHWFKDDYECLSIRILFEKWEWEKFNHQCFHFFDQFIVRVLIWVEFLEFFVFSNLLINSFIHLIDKTIFELSFCIFAFISCMLFWSTFIFLTDEAYFFCTILISSILIFSILIFSILINSRWKISMITTIDEINNELDEKRELDEVSFLINDYWRFQVINQLCQIIAEFKACVLTCRDLLTCID
jgi:hypothetical protein